MFDYIEAKVADLIPYALNSRTHSEQQINQIASSIRTFGFTSPVLVDEENNLIAGHGRIAAANILKMKTVPAIVVTGLDESKRRALVIADNRHGETSTWNLELLTQELEVLRDSVDVAAMGYTADEICKLLGEEVVSHTELSEEAVSDRWQLLIEFDNENDLAEAYEKANAEGLTCKIIM